MWDDGYISEIYLLLFTLLRLVFVLLSSVRSGAFLFASQAIKYISSWKEQKCRLEIPYEIAELNRRLSIKKPIINMIK